MYMCIYIYIYVRLCQTQWHKNNLFCHTRLSMLLLDCRKNWNRNQQNIWNCNFLFQKKSTLVGFLFLQFTSLYFLPLNGKCTSESNCHIDVNTKLWHHFNRTFRGSLQEFTRSSLELDVQALYIKDIHTAVHLSTTPSVLFISKMYYILYYISNEINVLYLTGAQTERAT